jgi:hypothetical protein
MNVNVSQVGDNGPAIERAELRFLAIHMSAAYERREERVNLEDMDSFVVTAGRRVEFALT